MALIVKFASPSINAKRRATLMQSTFQRGRFQKELSPDKGQNDDTDKFHDDDAIDAGDPSALECCSYETHTPSSEIRNIMRQWDSNSCAIPMDMIGGTTEMSSSFTSRVYQVPIDQGYSQRAIVIDADGSF